MNPAVPTQPYTPAEYEQCALFARQNGFVTESTLYRLLATVECDRKSYILAMDRLHEEKMAERRENEILRQFVVGTEADQRVSAEIRREAYWAIHNAEHYARDQSAALVIDLTTEPPTRAEHEEE